MNPETFCEYFATFAEAPNGIAKLRDLIRTLAIQGKLVAQNRNDEPAVAIVEQIQAEKLKLSETGDVKSDKKTWVSSLVNPPYHIPASWCWVRLQDVFEISRGGSPRPAGDPRFFGGSIPWITVGEVTKDPGKYLTGTTGGLTEEGSSKSRFINPGDLLLTNSGATLGVPKISKIRGCMNDRVAVLRQFHQVDLNEFAYLYLTQQTSAFRRVNQGMGQPNLNTPIIAGWFFPFPPLAEQRRIVEKVDQLLGLCDELAARQAAQREKQQRLVGATLDRLISTRNPAEFPTHAHRLRNHFDQLFDTPTTIPQLRQTILKLAVQGKLVPQDPNDEPASELIRRLSKEQAARVREKRIKELKPRTPVCHDESFPIPDTWKWVRMGNLIESMINGLYKHANFYSVQGTACVRMYNIQDGKLDLCKLQRIDLTDDELQHYLLEATDLVVNRVNSRELVGKAAVVGDHNEPLIFEAMNIRVRFLEKENLPAYANLLLRTDPVRMLFQTDAKQALGQASISQPQVANIAIPLPPLAEQKRIVTKVTELLSLCDALEAKLTQAESASTQLLSAAVHHLLQN